MPRLTRPERLAAIPALHARGMRNMHLAEHFGVDGSVIVRDLQALGLKANIPTAPERFFSYVEFSETNGYLGSPCLEWQGFRHPFGYGAFQLANGKPVLSHRWLYEYAIGPIPEGLHVDHLCRNPPCCNPAHLEPVTVRENARRGAWGMRWVEKTSQTHCKRGHELIPENIYPSAKNRNCRLCAAARRLEKAS